MIGATVACRICTRLVCDACGADWTTCEEPVALTVRMGMAARLRAVDPAGRYGAVSRFAGQTRLIDLRRMAWVELPAKLPRYSPYMPGYVLEDDAVVLPLWVYVSNVWWFKGVVVRPITGGGRVLAVPEGAAAPSGPFGVDGSLVWMRTTEETVHLVDLETERWTTVTPLPGKVVQAVHVDRRQSLLVAGTWGAATLFRIDGDDLAGLGRVTVSGDVRWVELAADTLAVLAGGTLTVWKLLPQQTIGPQLFTAKNLTGVEAIDLSRDGQYIALARDRMVYLLALPDGGLTRLGEHTDSICFLRFVGDEQLLVVGDNDNRVVVRPRMKHGYIERTVEVPLARTPVPYEPSRSR